MEIWLAGRRYEAMKLGHQVVASIGMLLGGCRRPFLERQSQGDHHIAAGLSQARCAAALRVVNCTLAELINDIHIKVSFSMSLSLMIFILSPLPCQAAPVLHFACPIYEVTAHDQSV